MMTSAELRVKNAETLVRQLKADEGFVAFPYDDPIVGKEAITIGYGRNLTAEGITIPEAELMLVTDINSAISEALMLFKDYDNFPYQVQHVICGMLFNLGPKAFRSFKRTIVALRNWDWEKAADEIMNSKAAEQLPNRYGRYAKALRDPKVKLYLNDAP